MMAMFHNQIHPVVVFLTHCFYRVTGKLLNSELKVNYILKVPTNTNVVNFQSHYFNSLLFPDVLPQHTVRVPLRNEPTKINNDMIRQY